MGFKDPLVRVCDFTQTQPKVFLEKKNNPKKNDVLQCFLIKRKQNHVNPSLPSISPGNQIYTPAASSNSEFGETASAVLHNFP